MLMRTGESRTEGEVLEAMVMGNHSRNSAPFLYLRYCVETSRNELVSQTGDRPERYDGEKTNTVVRDLDSATT